MGLASGWSVLIYRQQARIGLYFIRDRNLLSYALCLHLISPLNPF
jgi:hypothetical protein